MAADEELPSQRTNFDIRMIYNVAEWLKRHTYSEKSVEFNCW